MARGGLSFDGIGYHGTTFEVADDIKNMVASSGVESVEGLAVTITGNKQAGLGANGDLFFGRIEKYETDGYMTVQDMGYAEVPGVSGSLPTVGTNALVVNGAGAVKVSANAVGRGTVVSVDNTANVNTVLILIG